jgi:RHS repeat-associated protein
MIYSEVTSHVEKNRATSRYAYDALGRRTVSQDAGGNPLRTLYDAFSFEVIREGETFSDGSFTTRYSEGIQWTNNSGTEGSRYRWIGEGTESVKTRSLYEDGYGAGPGRYTGISVTLYGKGEAVAVSRSASTGSRGGPAYLGKDLMGSIRSTTNEYGVLEDRYEYDAFGKPYKGDLTSGMNLGYTGKPYDTATGLYNYGYRDYQPEAARFTTVDPVRDGANWFAYVNNDPVNWVDPWGLAGNVQSLFKDEFQQAVDNAISKIASTEYGKTPEGKEMVRDLQNMNNNLRIVPEDLNSGKKLADNLYIRGTYDPDNNVIKIDKNLQLYEYPGVLSHEEQHKKNINNGMSPYDLENERIARETEYRVNKHLYDAGKYPYEPVSPDKQGWEENYQNMKDYSNHSIEEVNKKNH